MANGNRQAKVALDESAGKKKHAKPSQPARAYPKAYATPVTHIIAPRVSAVLISPWYIGTTTRSAVSEY